MEAIRAFFKVFQERFELYLFECQALVDSLAALGVEVAPSQIIRIGAMDGTDLAAILYRKRIITFKWGGLRLVRRDKISEIISTLDDLETIYQNMDRYECEQSKKAREVFEEKTKSVF